VVAAADKLLAEVRERNKGFLDEALAALGNTITTAAKDVILQILADPITFAKNLFAGIAQGFQNFGKNILAQLGQRVVERLTGTVTQAGIQLPAQFDAEGILSLFLQITGLTIDHVKEGAHAIWGDKVVDFIEKVVAGVQMGVAGAEKAIAEDVAGLVPKSVTRAERPALPDPVGWDPNASKLDDWVRGHVMAPPTTVAARAGRCRPRPRAKCVRPCWPQARRHLTW
jgi:hypothetical protein